MWAPKPSLTTPMARSWAGPVSLSGYRDAATAHRSTTVCEGGRDSSIRASFLSILTSSMLSAFGCISLLQWLRAAQALPHRLGPYMLTSPKDFRYGRPGSSCPMGNVAEGCLLQHDNGGRDGHLDSIPRPVRTRIGRWISDRPDLRLNRNHRAQYNVGPSPVQLHPALHVVEA